jgi:hypothetical protein
MTSTAMMINDRHSNPPSAATNATTHVARGSAGNLLDAATVIDSLSSEFFSSSVTLVYCNRVSVVRSVVVVDSDSDVVDKGNLASVADSSELADSSVVDELELDISAIVVIVVVINVVVVVSAVVVGFPVVATVTVVVVGRVVVVVVVVVVRVVVETHGQTKDEPSHVDGVPPERHLQKLPLGFANVEQYDCVPIVVHRPSEHTSVATLASHVDGTHASTASRKMNATRKIAKVIL